MQENKLLKRDKDGWAVIPSDYALYAGRTEDEVKKLIEGGAKNLLGTKAQPSETLTNAADTHSDKPTDYSNEILVFSFAENIDLLKAKIRSTSQESSYLSNVIIYTEHDEQGESFGGVSVSDSSPTVKEFHNKLVVIKSRKSNADLMDEKRWLILPNASCSGEQITLDYWRSAKFLRLL